LSASVHTVRTGNSGEDPESAFVDCAQIAAADRAIRAPALQHIVVSRPRTPL
jgi:hypothetical protein